MRAGSRRRWRSLASTGPADAALGGDTTAVGAAPAAGMAAGAAAGTGAGVRAGCWTAWRCGGGCDWRDGCCCRRGWRCGTGGGLRGGTGRAGACPAASFSSCQALRSSSHGEGAATGGMGGGAEVCPVCLRHAASRRRCSSAEGGGWICRCSALFCIQFSHSHFTKPAMTAMTMIATWNGS